MIRVFADFNSRTIEGACWALRYQGIDLVKKIDELDLESGSLIILYQDDNDFEVLAKLEFCYVDMLERDGWIAWPDWSTLKDMQVKKT